MNNHLKDSYFIVLLIVYQIWFTTAFQDLGPELKKQHPSSLIRSYLKKAHIFDNKVDSKVEAAPVGQSFKKVQNDMDKDIKELDSKPKFVDKLSTNTKELKENEKNDSSSPIFVVPVLGNIEINHEKANIPKSIDSKNGTVIKDPDSKFLEKNILKAIEPKNDVPKQSLTETSASNPDAILKRAISTDHKVLKLFQLFLRNDILPIERFENKSDEVKNKSDEVKNKSDEVKNKSDEVKNKSDEVKNESDVTLGIKESNSDVDSNSRTTKDISEILKIFREAHAEVDHSFESNSISNEIEEAVSDKIDKEIKPDKIIQNTDTNNNSVPIKKEVQGVETTEIIEAVTSTLDNISATINSSKEKMLKVVKVFRTTDFEVNTENPNRVTNTDTVPVPLRKKKIGVTLKPLAAEGINKKYPSNSASRHLIFQKADSMALLLILLLFNILHYHWD